MKQLISKDFDNEDKKMSTELLRQALPNVEGLSLEPADSLVRSPPGVTRSGSA